MSKLHAAALADACAIAGVAALIWPSDDPKVATPVQTVEQYVIAPVLRKIQSAGPRGNYGLRPIAVAL